MDSKGTESHLQRFATIALLSLLFVACTPVAGLPVAATSGLTVWLDQPPDGSVLPLASFTLKAHARATASGGVIEIDFKVNEILLGSVTTDASAPLAYGELPWNPSAPGRYTIEAWGVDSAGAKVPSAVANVCVTDANGGGCSSQGPLPATPATPVTQNQSVSLTPQSPSPTAVTQSCEQLKNCTATATVTATATKPKPALTFTATSTPTNTLVPPSQTAVPQVQVSFAADSTTIIAGDCTTLHWTVQFATAVFLDGAGQGGTGQEKVCPPQTTQYNLHVDAVSGNVDQGITIIVTAPTLTTPAPSDITGPSVNKPFGQPSPSAYGSGCSAGTTGTTFQASVDDPSGIKNVQIYYRYETGGTLGGWNAVNASDGGSGNYSASIDNNAGSQAQSVLAGATGSITWYVLAQDNANNPTQSSTQSIQIIECPG